MAGHDTDETYLTVAEVAATLKLNQQTVRNWIDAGTLPAVRVGRRVRIKSSDFQRIIAESYSGAPAPGTATRTMPTADGFWGGEPVGRAEPGGPADAPDESSEPRP